MLFAKSRTKDLVVDLEKFTCGHSQLDKPLDPRDFFTASLLEKDVFKIEHEGFEIGTKNDLLEYLFITVGSFSGTYTYGGKPLPLDKSVAPEKILSLFGAPYWIDQSDGESIFFYEYEGGRVELQFEFPDQKKLGFITLTVLGVLSDPGQRKAYQVTAPWPPPKVQK